MSNHDLTPKQRLFVSEYLVDLNATQAYLRAGYVVKSESVAKVMAARLLTNDNVEVAIQDAIQARESRTLITADKVLAELGNLGFSNMDDYASWGPTHLTLKESDTLSRAIKAAVVEVQNDSVTVTRTVGDTSITETKSRVKVKLADKEGALDKIGRHLGMYPKEGGINVEKAIFVFDL